MIPSPTSVFPEALTIMDQAGTYLRAHFLRRKDLTIRVKSPENIVTSADLGAERIILSGLRRISPHWSTISEEAGTTTRREPFRWIVDPLDGTTNFSIGSPLFSSALALLKDEEILFAIVVSPAMRELFTARKGRGATVNGKRMRVAPTRRLAEAFHTVCPGHSERAYQKMLHDVLPALRRHGHGVRDLGSAALEFAYVASGRTDSYALLNGTPWDAAPGVLLVREAGGTVTTMTGEPWHLHAPTALASNGKIHRPLVRLLRPLWKR